MKPALRLGFKQLRRNFRFTHLVYSRENGVAAIFDASHDVVEDFKEALFGAGLKLGACFETAKHENSATERLAAEFGVPINPDFFQFSEELKVEPRPLQNAVGLFGAGYCFVKDREQVLPSLAPEDVIFYSIEPMGKVCALAGLVCSPSTEGAHRSEGRIAGISAEKYAQKLNKPARGALYLDVREPDEFESARMKGEVSPQNIPMAEIGFHLDEFKSADRIYVSCQTGKRSEWVAQTLVEWVDPRKTEVAHVVGGLKAWMVAGLPLEKGKL